MRTILLVKYWYNTDKNIRQSPVRTRDVKLDTCPDATLQPTEPQVA